MAKKYVTRCIVKKGGKEYKKGALIEDLTSEEIKQGIQEQWLEPVGLDEEPTPATKPGKETKRDKLLARAEEAGITVDEKMTDAEIEQKIKRAVLLARAEELNIEVKDEMTDEEIQKLIKEAKA